MKKELLKNIYKIINDYNNEIRYKYIIELSNNENKTFNYFHTELEQKVLDYDVSIYKNIEKKEILFDELLNPNNKNPYTLNSFETEIFRTYIGMYDNGEIQTLEQLNEKMSIPEELIENIIIEVLDEIHKPYFQKILLQERNKIKQQNILEKDISYLLMTDNLEQILRELEINTIKDIINITDEQICRMNVEYGYNPELLLPPTRILKQIGSMGQKINITSSLRRICKAYKKENNTTIKGLDIEDHTIYIDTKLDMLEALQFEPELLKTMNINERLIMDKLINKEYKYQQFINTLKQIEYEMINKKSTKMTINDIVKREFSYLTQNDIETIENIIKKEYSINNTKTDDEYIVESVYLKEKN